MVFVLSSQGLSVLLQMTRFHYFYGWMISHSIYMNHVLFIHSSIDGRWSCFCILAIVNNAAVNTGLHISFQVGVFVSLDKYPEMKLLDLMEVLFLIFEESPYCFPQWPHQFKFPQTAQLFLFFTSLPTLVISFSFWQFVIVI